MLVFQMLRQRRTIFVLFVTAVATVHIWSVSMLVSIMFADLIDRRTGKITFITNVRCYLSAVHPRLMLI